MAAPSYRLLVVDDSKRDTLLLERILQQANDATFTVTQMESAQTGLEELSTHPYDLCSSITISRIWTVWRFWRRNRSVV